MLCERVLGNVLADAGGIHRPDGCFEVEIFWWELGRRALRKKIRDGRLLRILLPFDQSLEDGDVLFDDGLSIVIARVVPAEVLIIERMDPFKTGLVCLELGNLHIPVEIDPFEIRVAADGPAEEVLHRLEAGYTRGVRRFQPRRCAGIPEVQVSPDLRVTR